MKAEPSDGLRGLNPNLRLRLAQRLGIVRLQTEAANKLFFGTHLGFQTRDLDLIDPALDSLSELIPVLRRGHDRYGRPYSRAERAAQQKRSDSAQDSHRQPLSPIEDAARQCVQDRECNPCRCPQGQGSLEVKNRLHAVASRPG